MGGVERGKGSEREKRERYERGSVQGGGGVRREEQERDKV